MTYQSHGYTIEDALARNNTVYEVEFSGWGTRSTVPPPAPGSVMPDENLQWPPPGSRPIPSSIAAIAIGPRSTVDRCWVTWDRQKSLNIPFADNLNPDAVVSLPRIVTCDAPVMFPQATTKGPSLDPTAQSWWDAMQAGTAYVFPWGPKPGLNNLAQGLGSVRHEAPFGTTTGFFTGQTFVDYTGQTKTFSPEEPFLHLLLYTKVPTFAASPRRAAMLREALWQAADTNPIIAGVYPIFGRKHVGISLISHNFAGVAAQEADYTIGLIRNVNESASNGLSPLFEVKATEALSVPANTGVNLQLSNPCADYVVIHVKNKSLLAPAGGALTVVAED